MSGLAQKGQGRRSIARRITRPRRTLGENDHEKLAVPLNLEFRSITDTATELGGPEEIQ